MVNREYIFTNQICFRLAARCAQIAYQECKGHKFSELKGHLERRKPVVYA
jgi:hypothetical protein